MAYLILNKANLNARNREGSTPLHLAALQGQNVSIEMLLRAGADWSPRDLEGASPVHVAAMYGQELSIMTMAEVCIAMENDCDSGGGDDGCRCRDNDNCGVANAAATNAVALLSSSPSSSSPFSSSATTPESSSSPTATTESKGQEQAGRQQRVKQADLDVEDCDHEKKAMSFDVFDLLSGRLSPHDQLPPQNNDSGDTTLLSGDNDNSHAGYDKERQSQEVLSLTAAGHGNRTYGTTTHSWMTMPDDSPALGTASWSQLLPPPPSTTARIEGGRETTARPTAGTGSPATYIHSHNAAAEGEDDDGDNSDRGLD